MERIAKKSFRFQDAAARDIEQQVSMTPQERILIARLLQKRVYSDRAQDVRACRRND